jgi:endonuclease/exonuclease/phosphatase (EEP) superfamily protein YafD
MPFAGTGAKGSRRGRARASLRAVQSRRLQVSAVVAALAVLPALATAFGALGSRVWLLDLCAHMTAQCAFALVAAGLALLFARRWLWCALLAPFVLLACLRTAPLFVGRAGARPSGSAERVLRLASVNLRFDNDDHAAVLAMLRSEPFDVIAVTEMTKAWLSALQALNADYPHYRGWPGTCFGIGLWSRYPLQDAQVLPLGSPVWPAIRAVVLAPQGACTLLVVHAPRPGLSGQADTDFRDRALAAIPRLLEKAARPRIVIGDCNDTRWSGAFGSLLSATGLADSADGRGWQPSWPTSLPSLLRIPIDQCLIEPTVAVLRRRLGPDVGSDHLPLFVDLELPQ